MVFSTVLKSPERLEKRSLRLTVQAALGENGDQ
jgi:hypothetical protein